MSKYELGAGYVFPGPDGKPAFLCSRPVAAGMCFPPDSIAIAVRECRVRGVPEAQILAWRASITHADDLLVIDQMCRDYDAERDEAEAEAEANAKAAAERAS